MTSHRTRPYLLVLLLATSSIILPAQADAATPSTTRTPTSTTTIAMPGPGHSVTWDSAITNSNTAPTDVFLRVESVDDPGGRFGSLLVVSVHDAHQRILIPPTPLTRLLRLSPLNLGPAGSGATVAIGGTVTLSRNAANDLQGRSASIVFRLGSVAQTEQAGLGGLADTGSTLALAAMILAFVLMVGGAGSLLARRLTEHHP